MILTGQATGNIYKLFSTNGACAIGHDRYSKLSKLEEDWWNASKEMSELDLERYLYFILQAASLDCSPITE